MRNLCLKCCLICGTSPTLDICQIPSTNFTTLAWHHLIPSLNNKFTTITFAKYSQQSQRHFSCDVFTFNSFRITIYLVIFSHPWWNVFQICMEFSVILVIFIKIKYHPSSLSRKIININCSIIKLSSSWLTPSLSFNNRI